MDFFTLSRFWTTTNSLGRPFYYLWCGQTVSILGSALLEFALGIWVYQKTGSVLDFSLVIAASLLPALLFLPFSGRIVDRFNRYYVMAVADMLSALLIMILAWLLWQHSFEMTHLYIFIILASLVGSLRGPAYSASLSQLLPKKKYTQANGLIGISSNIVSMFAPMVGGNLMAAIGLPGIAYIDFIAFCLGSALILRAFFLYRKDVPLCKLSASSNDGSFTIARAYFRKEPLMLGLFFYALLLNASLVLISTMMIPMILSHYSVQDLGIILTVGSIGGLLGSLVLVFVNIPRYMMPSVLIGDVILSVCIVFAGVTTHFIVYCACAFVGLFAAGFSEGCTQSIWMKKVPLQFQGRIFSVQSSVILATTLIILLLGGFGVEKILEPALSNGGILNKAFGAWIGMGNGAALGIMFVACGALGVFISLSALATPLCRLEFVVPDIEVTTEQKS